MRGTLKQNLVLGRVYSDLIGMGGELRLCFELGYVEPVV
jgi:hypothetical protein